MKISDYELYRSLLKDKSGLVLPPEKSYLLDSRLMPVAKKWGYPTLSAMTMTLYGVPETELIEDITEAMADHETSFFRDPDIFNTFSAFILPYFANHRKHNKKLRIWSAGCATGQEPYSIAMTVLENLDYFHSKHVDIYATDMSKAFLDKAEAGKYSQYEVQRGLPVKKLLEYFEPLEKNSWVAKRNLKRMITFDHHNLLETMDYMDEFDVIFCSHVLQNFDKDTQASIIHRMTELLPEDGFLLIAENPDVDQLTGDIKPVKSHPGLYILSDGRYKFTDKDT